MQTAGALLRCRVQKSKSKLTGDPYVRSPCLVALYLLPGSHTMRSTSSLVRIATTTTKSRRRTSRKSPGVLAVSRHSPSLRSYILTDDFCSEEPVKLSKSAIKKAQSLARKERRQQQKAQARAAKAAGGASPEAPLTPQTPETKLPEALPTPAAAPVALPKASEIPAEPSKVEVHPPSAKTSYGVHAAANGTSNDGESKVTEKPSVELSQSKTMKVSPQAPAVPAASVPVPAPQAPSPPSLEEGTTSTASTSTSTLPLPEEAAKKRQNVLERVVWTFIMIGGFIGESNLSVPVRLRLVAH